MTAREKFKKGDRVRLTALAKEKGLHIRPGKKSGLDSSSRIISGTVVAPHVVGVIVLPDTHSPGSKVSWHMDFWEVISGK